MKLLSGIGNELPTKKIPKIDDIDAGSYPTIWDECTLLLIEVVSTCVLEGQPR